MRDTTVPMPVSELFPYAPQRQAKAAALDVRIAESHLASAPTTTAVVAIVTDAVRRDSVTIEEFNRCGIRRAAT